MGHKLGLAGLSFETTHPEAWQAISDLNAKTLGARSSSSRGHSHRSSYGRGRW